MLHFITKPTQIIDRVTLQVTPMNDQLLSFDAQNLSRWIICDGYLDSENLKINSKFGAVINHSFSIRGHGIIINTPGYKIEENIVNSICPGIPGHLSYIDGCSNTGLIGPVRNGDPCINYLYFPIGTVQTMHTHPSCRIGMILTGNGIADVNEEMIPLKTGDVFILDKFSKHRFITTDHSMSLMVFHPDSEDGPRDEHNPMKSRTYL